MLILGIESSCDETGVALIGATPHQHPTLLADALHSQIDMHQAYGGVVPELASRDHIQRLIPLITQVLQQSNTAIQSIDAIAYTAGPGLAGALLTGSAVATSMAMALGKPAWPIHHLEGHLLSPFLSTNPPQFPFVALLVSGGHTQLMQVNGVGNYQLLGETIDDAAGEAFDKTAKLLGLPYPGGPALSRLAQQGNPTAYRLPRPLLHSNDFDFSFAGLKTAVLTQVKRLMGVDISSPIDTNQAHNLSQQTLADVAASTQAAIVDVLTQKTIRALKHTHMNRLVVAGGVGANTHLRTTLNAMCQQHGIIVHYPELHLCTDNGAMIAMAAALRWQAGLIPKPSETNNRTHQPTDFSVHPRWPLQSICAHTPSTAS